MTDVIHKRTSDNTGTAFLMGVIALIIFLILAFYYLGFGRLLGGATNTAPQVNVPGKIDVNVNK